MTYIKPQCDNDCLAVLKYQQIDNQSAVNFSGKYFPVKRLFALLNLPEMLSGHADFDLDFSFSSSSLIQGKLNFFSTKWRNSWCESIGYGSATFPD